MSYGQYRDDLRPNAVIESKWKSTEQNSTRSMFGCSVLIRRLTNPIDRNGKFTKKGGSCQETSLFVPRLRVLNLARRGWVKLNAQSVDRPGVAELLPKGPS